MIHGQLEQLGKTDWRALFESNPVQAFERQAEQQRLLSERSRLSIELLKDDLARSAESDAVRRLEVAQSQAAIRRDIPGWSQELSDKVARFAEKDLGVSPEGWEGVTDPRLIKALWMAFTSASSQKPTPDDEDSVRQARPATTLGSRAPAMTALHDGLSMDEWTRQRRAQVRRASERR
jgi:hypothetical protein